MGILVVAVNKKGFEFKKKIIFESWELETIGKRYHGNFITFKLWSNPLDKLAKTKTAIKKLRQDKCHRLALCD